jgi:outer membrane protein insertion porin family
MRHLALFLFLVLAGATATAQSYTPKTIRIEGVPAADVPELLRIAALTPNTAMSKEQIESALQRIGDTGLFTDLNYTVNNSALVFTLKGSPETQALPVRFINLVWWQPEELEKILEARIPVFKGKLPLAGKLTDQVTDTIAQLLRAKGINNPAVSTIQSGSLGAGPTSVGILVTRPMVLLSNIEVDGATPDAAQQITRLQGYLGGQDFNLAESPRAIVNGVTEFFRNAGFLDIAAKTPFFGPPRKDPPDSKDPDRYLIDVTVPITGGDLYRVSRIQITPAAPVSKVELEKILKIRAGDPATIYDLGVARSNLASAYFQHGYLDAEAQLDEPKNTAAHTIAYTFTMVPGTQYRVGSVDASGLSTADQAAFAKNWHVQNGELLDQEVSQTLARVIEDIHSSRQILVGYRPDKHSHIVVLVIVYARSSASK